MHADAVRQRFDGGDEGLGRAVALAIGVHVLLALVLWLGAKISWDRQPLSVAGAQSMEATLDVSSADQRAVTRALEFEPEPMPEPTPEPIPEPAPLPLPEPVEQPVAPLPQPEPEPRPQDAPAQPQPRPQDRVPDPAPIDQEEVRRDAERERARIQQEQEARRRQEQIELAERQKQEEAEQKRRQAQQQLERLRAERERVAREAREAEQRVNRIAAQREAQQASQQAASPSPPPPGNQGVDDGLAARYAAALQEAILRNWTRPDSVPLGQRCRIVIRQIPGGTVTSAEVDPSCPYDELGRRSVEAAVLRAQPLPYAGFESVFQRTLIVNFTAQDR